MHAAFPETSAAQHPLWQSTELVQADEQV